MAEEALKEATIDDYIEDYHDQSLSFDHIHFKTADTYEADTVGTTDVLILDDCFVEKYYTDLEDLVYTRTLTVDELYKYRCNPWLLSYDLYGTVELWSLILDLNNMTSAIEFTQSKIKLYEPSIIEYVDDIMSAEETLININQAEIDDDFNLFEDNNDSDDDDDIEGDDD